MIAYVLHRVGQSIYDLCLQTYGTLDLLVKFCNDNNVSDMQDIPQQVNYQYDTALVKFQNNPNIYNTLYGVVDNFAAYVTQNNEYYITETGDFYITQNDADTVPSLPYVFHTATQTFLDKVASVTGQDWITNIPYQQAVNLDIFVRNLKGEASPDYDTQDIWSKLAFLHPVMSSIAGVQAINLIDPTKNLTYHGTVTHTDNTFTTAGALTDYVSTGYFDGTATVQNNMCLGVFFSRRVLHFAEGDIIGAKDSGGGCQIDSISSTSYLAEINAASPSMSYSPARDQDFLHVQSGSGGTDFYRGIDNDLLSHKPFNNGTQSTLEYKMGFYNQAPIEMDFNLSYAGQGLNKPERKALFNSVNAFMYRKGIIDNFIKII